MSTETESIRALRAKLVELAKSAPTDATPMHEFARWQLEMAYLTLDMMTLSIRIVSGQHVDGD